MSTTGSIISQLDELFTDDKVRVESKVLENSQEFSTGKTRDATFEELELDDLEKFGGRFKERMEKGRGLDEGHDFVPTELRNETDDTPLPSQIELFSRMNFWNLMAEL
jgi:hypothetical protein